MKEKKHEGSAVFTLQLYRQLSRYGPVGAWLPKRKGWQALWTETSSTDPASPDPVMGQFQVRRAGRTEDTHFQASLSPSGIPALRWGQPPQSKEGRLRFPSNVRSSSLNRDLRVLQAWEEPLAAGPPAEVPCISGNRRSRERWSSLSSHRRGGSTSRTGCTRSWAAQQRAFCSNT